LYAFIFLLFISLINFFNNDSANFSQYINGVREVFNLILFLVILDGIFKSNNRVFFEKCFDFFVLIFLLSQIPISIYQYVSNNSIAGDWVGGSLGNGGSGVLTVAIILMIAYKVQRENNFNKQIFMLIASGFFLIPTLINETKITFILFPIMIFSLIKFNNKLAPIFFIAIAIAFVSVFSNFYNQFKGDTYSMEFEDVYTSNFLEEYLAGEDVTVDDIPRFTKLGIGIQLLNEDNKLLFGEDLAAFKGGSATDRSEFGDKHEWLLVGSRPYIFYLLICGGFALVCLILYLLIKEILDGTMTGSFLSSSLKVLLILLFIILLFYNDSLRNNFFQIVFISMIFISKPKQKWLS
jgi:hypothetical protein